MLSRVGSGLVGFDDLLHQTVAHHIFFSEVALRDAVHALENLKCIHKAAAGAVGQVDLSEVAGVELGIVSVGPEREQTIVLKKLL